MKDLSEIYKSYADEVKRFLICLTSNVDLAEELTQETFYQKEVYHIEDQSGAIVSRLAVGGAEFWGS